MRTSDHRFRGADWSRLRSTRACGVVETDAIELRVIRVDMWPASHPGNQLHESVCFYTHTHTLFSLSLSPARNKLLLVLLLVLLLYFSCSVRSCTAFGSSLQSRRTVAQVAKELENPFGQDRLRDAARSDAVVRWWQPGAVQRLLGLPDPKKNYILLYFSMGQISS